MIVAAALAWPAAAADAPAVLRVCGDPDNLPFSNTKSEGFENKIAEVIAADLGMKLEYYWWPHQRGLDPQHARRRHLRRPDQHPQGFRSRAVDEAVLPLRLRVAQLSGNGAKVTSLDDPR